MITLGDLAIFLLAIIIIMWDRDRRLRMEGERKGSNGEWLESREVGLILVGIVGIIIIAFPLVIIWMANNIVGK